MSKSKASLEIILVILDNHKKILYHPNSINNESKLCKLKCNTTTYTNEILIIEICIIHVITACSFRYCCTSMWRINNIL